MNQAHQLAIAQLATYTFLILPVLFNFFQHGRQGYLGWGFLFAFCALRIIGSALKIHYDNEGVFNSTATIISSIGVSPLLLAVIGIIHESRYYINHSLPAKIEWILVLVLHMIVTAGVALIGTGSSAFSPTDANKDDLTLLRAGMAVLEFVWILVTILSIVTIFQLRSETPGYRAGKTLLLGVLFALPFIGIRATYGLASIISDSANLNPVTGVFGFQVGLDFVPELIAVISLVVTGLFAVRIAHFKRPRTATESMIPRHENKK